jgi:hypothetical protein
MILRKYGTSVHSVDPNFDSRAMNEVGFQKNGKLTLSTEEFGQKYRRDAVHELTASADGLFQQEAEDKVLNSLRDQLQKLEAGLEAGSVLFVESEQGKDYPKSRERQRTIVVGNENKLHFERAIDPPLRIGIYTENAS